MAFCNTSQYIAKRLIKNKNIINSDQVEKTFKSSAYLAWDNTDRLSNYGNTETCSTPFIYTNKMKSLGRRKSKHSKSTNPTNVNSDCGCIYDTMDNTLVPLADNEEIRPLNQQTGFVNNRSSNNVSHIKNNDKVNKKIGRLLSSSIQTQIMISGHIIICGSGTEVEMLLCGKTCPPLIYNSSFTITSSPNTVVPSIRTHRPTTLLHPTIQLFTYFKLHKYTFYFTYL